MLAAPARRCRTGSTRASRAACSSCGSRTPTPPATGPSGPRASSPRSTGSASPAAATRARTSSRRTPVSTAPPPPGCYAEGRAYYCDCTREHVQARTGSQYTGYDGFCRDRGLEAAEGRALRFRTPDEGATVVVDLIRGEPTFENKLLEDFVIARGDGSPVFLLANVVDDMTMGITHVIRAEEHLPNTPKQQLLWEALGVKPPIWAHVPVDRQREAAEALQAPRQGGPGGVPRRGLPRRRDAQLPDAARLGAVRRPRDRAVVGHRGRVPPRGGQPVAGVLRREEAARVQRRVHPGTVRRGVRRGLRAVAGRHRDDPGAAVAAGGVRRDRLRRGRAAGPDPDRRAQRDRAERRLPLPRRARQRRGRPGRRR